MMTSRRFTAAPVLLCAAVALSACTTMGTEPLGLSKQRAGHVFMEEHRCGVSGTMSAALKDGRPSRVLICKSPARRRAKPRSVVDRLGIRWGGWAASGPPGYRFHDALLRRVMATCRLRRAAHALPFPSQHPSEGMAAAGRASASSKAAARWMPSSNLSLALRRRLKHTLRRARS